MFNTLWPSTFNLEKEKLPKKNPLTGFKNRRRSLRGTTEDGNKWETLWDQNYQHLCRYISQVPLQIFLGIHYFTVCNPLSFVGSTFMTDLFKRESERLPPFSLIACGRNRTVVVRAKSGSEAVGKTSLAAQDEIYYCAGSLSSHGSLSRQIRSSGGFNTYVPVVSLALACEIWVH